LPEWQGKVILLKFWWRLVAVTRVCTLEVAVFLIAGTLMLEHGRILLQ
jgi:hypothetical protein